MRFFICMALGLEMLTMVFNTLIFNIVRRPVCLSQTAKKITKTIKTYMPWCCLQLVMLPLFIQKQVSPNVTTSFRLSMQSHVIIMYQYSSASGSSYTVILTPFHRNTLYLWLVTLHTLVTLGCGKDPWKVEIIK